MAVLIGSIKAPNSPAIRVNFRNISVYKPTPPLAGSISILNGRDLLARFGGRPFSDTTEFARSGRLLVAVSIRCKRRPCGEKRGRLQLP